MCDVGYSVLDDDSCIDSALRHRVGPYWFTGSDLHRRDGSIASASDQDPRAAGIRHDRCRISRIVWSPARRADPDALAAPFVEGIVAMPPRGDFAEAVRNRAH